MLLFIDEPRHVRIVRQGEAGGVREPIGRIRKVDPTITDSVRALLQPAELDDVEAAFALLAQADAARLKGWIAGLPEQTRAVIAFYKDGASPAERRWIRGSLQEALRLIRRHDRDAETPA